MLNEAVEVFVTCYCVVEGLITTGQWGGVDDAAKMLSEVLSRTLQGDVMD